MTEYIDRDKTIAEIDDCFPVNPTSEFSKGVAVGLAMAKVAVNHIPAADVRPVITCGECKHSDTFSPDCTEATFPLKCLSIRYGGVYPNWFCEHGVKREES